MGKKTKLDAVSVLASIKKKASLNRPAPLVGLPPEEIAAFQALRAILVQSRLLADLRRKETTDHGERVVFVNEDLVHQRYPGVDVLTGHLAGIDAFIYVYDGITGQESPAARARRDFRQFFGELGFRQLLLEFDRACKIHKFCSDNMRPNRIVIEPITQKPTASARKEAFQMPGRAKEVFQQITRKIRAEMDAADGDVPPVFRDAYQFSCDLTEALEPLARMGRQVRGAIGRE